MKSLRKKLIYPFKKYEAKWKDFKIQKKTNGENKYILEMLPYPSGDIHMGHVRNYTIGDIISRLKHLQGYNIFHPMGFDSNGLPAENAAREYKIHPKIWTESNITNMKKQLKSLFFSYDWDHEIQTHTVDYYKFQQKLFIKMYNLGLIKKKEEYVNWDPVDETVLANEQVINGKGWRSGAIVQQKLLSQWFCTISDFAEILLNDINKLEGHWPSQILTMQRNWIGKSVGYGIRFNIINENKHFIYNEVEIFTKSPFLLEKIEFIGLAPESQFAIELYKHYTFIEEFIKNNPRDKINKDTRGIFTNIWAINPYNKKKIPIYICNYVLGDVGTGSVMGVPSICENDYNFAINNSITIKFPININKDYLDNITNENNQLTKELLDKKIIFEKTTYKIKDWCISRQRYWGVLIPMIYCNKCGIIPNENIPVNLPHEMDDLKSHIFKKINCPKCGGDAEKETDTMDTFVDSSWYFWRYVCATNKNEIFDEKLKKFPAVDLYIGGPEHAVLHLLFARFFGKVLKKLNLIEEDEPFRNFYTQGMICMRSYKNHETGTYINPKDIFEENGKLYTNNHGIKQRVEAGPIEKMSKSKKNTVNPMTILSEYGADSVRLFVVSDTPCNKDLQWSDKSLNGCWCFNNRIWSISNEILNKTPVNIKEIEDNESPLWLDNSLLKKEENFYEKDEFFKEYAENSFYTIIKDLDTININVAIANIRIFVNYVEDNMDLISPNLLKEKWKDLMKLYWCLCPIISLEVLELLGDDLCFNLPVNKSKSQSEVYELVIQKNGKKLFTLEVKSTLNQEDIIKIINEKYSEYNLSNYKKVVFIKYKIINFVI